ncbi:biosynthetic arginine decarboxylase, partial [bacterium]|nr:biosynthetic arginine decarboxylase [bacterium]
MKRNNFKITDAVSLYGLENWSGGYFDINKDGNLTVRPSRDDIRSVDIKAIVDELVRKKIQFPVNMRFGQILDDRVRYINECFKNAITEFEYKADYLGVFPMKVNHRKEIVDELLHTGREYSLGVEVGSKPELAVALSFNLKKKSLIICNGFKDKAYLDLAICGKLIGNNVIIVIEKLSEIFTLLKLVKEKNMIPDIGVRMKLYSKGTGKWEKSGGEYSKFGFTTMQLLDLIDILQKNNLLESLAMLHFHIGSQITDIRSIKGAIKEAARVYSKLHKMDIHIKYLNVGGGLGVDYDGSKTTFDSSANYTPQEYANDIVYTIQDVCHHEDVHEPIIVTECGRALTAYHSIIITDLNDVISFSHSRRKLNLTGRESAVIIELSDIFKTITRKNYREYYHDAIHQKDEMLTHFNLGFLSLEERAKG